MNVKEEAVNDIEEGNIIIQPENYFSIASTSLNEKPNLESEKIKIQPVAPLATVTVKSEPGRVECVDSTNSGTLSPKIELVDNVQVEDLFLDPSDTYKIKKEADVDEKLKIELLSEECDLGTIKQEDIHFDEPCRQSQKCLASKQRAVKKNKWVDPCPVCRKECSASNSRKIDVNKHIGKRYLKGYTDERQFECNICSKQFKRKDYLKDHIRIHTGEKPFTCEICSKRFTRHGHLKDHMTIHTGEKRFKCEICSKRFTRNGHLKDHIRIHTGEKRFKCEICSKRFIQNGHFKDHMTSHTGEKRFKCEICLHTFTQNGHLKDHMPVHTGERPFRCTICSKQFQQNRKLTRHMKTHTVEK